MPKRESTVSLLVSFAFKSPTSPFPLTGVAKWMAIAAFAPPAEIPQRDLKAALRHRAMTRSPGMDLKVFKSGDRVSRITAVSLRISARRRYVFASG